MNFFGLLCLLVSTVLVNGHVQSIEKTFATGQYLITYPQILSSTGNKVCLTLLDGYVPKNKDLIVTINDARNQTLDTQTFSIEKDSTCFALETKSINGPFVILSFKLDSDLFVTKMIPFVASYGMTKSGETVEKLFQVAKKTQAHEAPVKVYSANHNTAQRQSFSGSKIFLYSGEACALSKISDSCPDCRARVESSMIDQICANPTVLATIKPTQINSDGLVTCGKFDVSHSFGSNLTHIKSEPFTVNGNCDCDSLSSNYVILISDLLAPAKPNTIQKPKALGSETIIVPATPYNVQNLATFYSTLCQ